MFFEVVEEVLGGRGEVGGGLEGGGEADGVEGLRVGLWECGVGGALLLLLLLLLRMLE